MHVHRNTLKTGPICIREHICNRTRSYEVQCTLFWRRKWQPTPVLLPGKSHGWRSLVVYSPWGHKESDTTERLHFHFSLHALEKEMATHSSVLAWRIPRTGEPGGLPSMGSHRVRHDWSDLAAAAAAVLCSVPFHFILLHFILDYLVWLYFIINPTYPGWRIYSLV